MALNMAEVKARMEALGDAALAKDKSLSKKHPLQHRRYFPSFAELPDYNDLDLSYYEDGDLCCVPSFHWCFIGEIFDDKLAQADFLRNRVFVTDVAGDETNLCFYPDDEKERNYFDFKLLKKGYTVCVRYAHQKQFLDGSNGIRLEDLEHVKVIKCSLATLMEISEINPLMKQVICWACGKPENQLQKLFSCRNCKLAKYCGKDCQAGDWCSHKKYCKIIPDFVQLSNIKFNKFTDFIPFWEMPK